MLSWQWPLFFLLLPVPWLVRRFLPAVQTADRGLRLPTHRRAIRSATGSEPVSAAPWLAAVLSLLIWALLLVAAARPVWYGEPTPVPSPGRDLMLAVDISDSMRSDDMVIDGRNVTRVQAAKSVVADFVKQRTSDRIGLILFGQQAFLQTPLTFDHNAVTTQLNEALAGFAGSSTAIGDMLGMAVQNLRNRQAESRVLILLTDGESTSGSDPIQAATIAAEAGVRVHSVGIGAATQLARDESGTRRRVKAATDLDESTLQKIAELTGGQFFRAHDPAEMAAVYQTIDRLEPSPEPRMIRPRRSLLHWPLGAALVLALIVAVQRRGHSR